MSDMTYQTVAHGFAVHRDCGGEVERGKVWSDWSGTQPTDDIKCKKCGRKWSARILGRMSGPDLSARFIDRPKVDSTTHVLAWFIDPTTKQRFTRLVPLYEAAGLERVKT